MSKQSKSDYNLKFYEALAALEQGKTIECFERKIAFTKDSPRLHGYNLGDCVNLSWRAIEAPITGTLEQCEWRVNQSTGNIYPWCYGVTSTLQKFVGKKTKVTIEEIL